MSDAVDLGILIPLKEEFREVHELLDLPRPTASTSPYYLFDLPSSDPDAPYRAAATFVGGMGGESAAVATERLVTKHRPQTVVVLGIAGGLDDDILVGDVVVATVVDSYLVESKAVPAAVRGRGRRAAEGVPFDFKLSGKPFGTTEALVQRIDHFEFVDGDPQRQWQMACLTDLEGQVKDAKKRETLRSTNLVRERPTVCKGHVAAGPTVGGTAAFGQWLKNARDRKYVALEMESHGVLESVQTQGLSIPHTLVLRGISDFGDERKKKLDRIGRGGLRRYAIRNAVRLFRTILKHGVLPAPMSAGAHPMAASTVGSSKPLQPSTLGTTVPSGAPYYAPAYVRRPKQEQEALDNVLRFGPPIELWGPSKSGKSWLLARLRETIEARLGNEARFVDVNLERLKGLESSEAFLRQLAYSFVSAARQSTAYGDSFWGQDLVPTQKLTQIVEDLVRLDPMTKFVLMFRNMEALRERSYRKDFEGLLRSWSQEIELRNVRLILTISTTPELAPDSLYRSPLRNVSHRIQLVGFDLDQLAELAGGHGLRWGPSELVRIEAFTGGNPYLANLAMEQVSRHGRSLEQVLDVSDIEGSIFYQHVGYVGRLLDSPHLRKGISSVLRDPRTTLASKVYDHLWGAGIIHKVGGAYRIRSTLYEAYFRTRAALPVP